MPFEIIQGDITKLNVDAVVNAANSRLAPGGGVCGAIFSAAGYDRLDKACRAIGSCATGSAVITDGFDLQAKYIIHAVGPVWQGGSCGEERILKSAYRCSMELAVKYGCCSIAFPLISSGIYGYPKEKAILDAASAIKAFLEHNKLDVFLVLFDDQTIEIAKKVI